MPLRLSLLTTLLLLTVLGFTATATSNNYGADCQEVWLVQLAGARPPPTKV
jgi:hypothetical protein